MKARCLSLSLALLILVLTGSPATAQSQKNSSFVDKVEVTDGVVTFHPKEGHYVAFMMTVAGPDEFWLEQSFSGQEAPSLHIQSKKGNLPDGTYTIEVRARPKISDKQRATLEEVRHKGDRYEIQKLMKEIGFNPSAMAHAIYLGVAKGAFLNPNVEEETTRKDMGKDMGALENTLDIQSVQLTGRRWDAAYLPNQAGGYAAADATNAAVQNAAITAETTPPPFAQPASRQAASWYEASFQNTTEDGTSVTYQGYLRPVALDGTAKVFQAYFQKADGAVIGPWQQGYFRAEENGYRFLNHADVARPAQAAPLFNYVAQDDTPQDPLDATLPDFVINDDLIVDGSACIGFDCVNGEVFSFDTIRLKENNLRIKADDTSTVPSFPANDWQLTFNESANGGASKFSVEDISGSRTPFTIEANARSHSLYVDDGGRIGSRTSTPSVEIHTIDGDTPTLRLQQDGSSGFEPQTWDVAGNETNFFVRDVTNGSALPFRIRPSAPSNSIFVDIDGDIGLNTSSPQQDLHIQDTGTDNAALRMSTASHSWDLAAIETDGDFVITKAGAGMLNPFLEIDDATGDVIISGDCMDQMGANDCATPDYVFEADYELLSLTELEAFVRANKHLPNVPNAAEIKENGLNLRGFNYAVLEKVEELVLYTLEQQKTIEQQQQNAEQQQQLIEALKARLETLESKVGQK